MIENFLKLLVVLTIAMLLAAALCAIRPDETLEQGIVVGKEHKGSWVQLIRINGTWYPINHPEKFSLTVQGDDENGKTITDEWKVDENFYNRVRIGDQVSAPEE